MTKRVQVTIDAELRAHFGVAMTDPVGATGLIMKWPVREEESLIRRRDTYGMRCGFVAGTVCPQYLDGLGVQCDSPHSMGLGVLLDAAASRPDIVPTDLEHSALQVRIEPTQRELLRTTDTSDHGQPNKGPPIVVLLPRCGDDSRRICRAWRIGLRCGRTWLASGRGRVRVDPFPAHRGGEGAADDVVNLSDGCRGQRPTGMGLAHDDPAADGGAVMLGMASGRWAARSPTMLDRAALMRTIKPMVDLKSAVAPRPTAAQLRVELLEYLSGDSRDGRTFQCWPDVATDVGLVPLASRLVQLGNSQPRVKGRAESRLGARVALLVDLG
jgi:hypothetical protein